MAELKLENSIVDDRYLVDRPLGRGSYAEVFLAFDQAAGDAAVIIKALNSSLQGTPDAELERTLVENFQNEAIALDRLRHPHIIRRLGHGTACDLEGVPFHYLVLEYMSGGDLLKLCSKRPLSLDQSLYLFQQVAEALAFAHSCHVIHRDVKPNNLLLSADEKTVKIADFGVAKMTADDRDEITRVGTNVYAPPEHHPDCEDEEPVDKLTPSADVYSLAKTIYTAMIGRAPRQFSRQPIGELPSELACNPWGSRLGVVLRKATESRVAERYQSIQEFWEDFARLRLGETDEAQLAEDDETTVVRSRLKAASGAGPAAARPDFQALGASTTAAAGYHARIVVELPRRIEPVHGAESPPRQPLLTEPPQPETASIQTRTLGSEQVDMPRASELRSKSRLANIRVGFKSEWLSRAFIIFLLAAFIGLAASTYFHYAGQGDLLGLLGIVHPREGVIAGALNVNLRSDPGGEVLVVLPAGTRVRVLEERSGWLRVKVLQWAGSQPDTSANSGWVGGQFVKSD